MNSSAPAQAAAAAWAGADVYAKGAKTNPGPDDTINMALIGCGTRGGNQVMPSFMELPGVRMTAVCDVNSNHLAKYRQKAGGDSIVAYHDYRKLLEDKSIDAVIVATQAHWHVPIAVAACQAGKDVYLEKPLGNSIGEGQYLIEAAKNGFVLDYTMRMGSRRVRRSHAKCFYGTEASMVVDRSRISIAPEPKGKKDQTDAGYLLGEEEEILPADDKFRHSAVFLENIRDRKQPETDAQTGQYATNLGHLMNVSWQLGRSVRWDGEKEQVIGDEQANALVTKPYRKGWELRV